MANPGFAPEHAARQAIAKYGPEAAAWAAMVRERYPDATDDGLARLAVQQFIRQARRRGAVASLAGAGAGVSTIATVQASLVLHIAAAYRVDPTSDDRAKELLVLLRMPRLTEPTDAALRHLGRAAGAWAFGRITRRVVPFGAAVAGAVTGTRGTAAVADRAIALYRNFTAAN